MSQVAGAASRFCHSTGQLLVLLYLDIRARVSGTSEAFLWSGVSATELLLLDSLFCTLLTLLQEQVRLKNASKENKTLVLVKYVIYR